ncbi:MAG: 16S rRNA (guanine(527)-N(7))-methyltransferase RsmG [Desulfobulbaceae bacterium A2]|nr:MAG: 16S rRNA (guanine(527)-N(7))-methyltransferase RsmG [Desulfobulbaceae bacterium A2]
MITDIKRGTEEGERLLAEGIAALGLTLDHEARGRLARYALELLHWNRRVNLVARGMGLSELVDKHFLDSLLLLPLLRESGGQTAHLLDIGTGAGFPGLALKAAWPALRLTLVEPRQKRVSFLGHISRSLGLTGVEILPHRLEEVLSRLQQQHFSHIVSRALAEPAIFLPLVQPLMNTATRVILMQGGCTVPPPLPTGWEECGRHEVCLPFSGDQRRLVLVQCHCGKKLVPGSP